MAEDAQRGLRDIHRLVADAFQFAVDAGNGHGEAKVSGHNLLRGQELDHALVHFNLQLVDGRLFLDHAVGHLLFAVQHRLHGLVNRALRQAAHPHQAILQFLQLFFKVAFHSAAPHPKRPVI